MPGGKPQKACHYIRFTVSMTPKEGADMNNSKGFSKLWFLLLLLVTFVAGCSGKDDNGPPPKAFTAYTLGGVAGTINETAKTLSVTVPYGTNVTAQVATFATNGTAVKVGAVAQVSGTTANNFTAPVAYTVTASDNTTATYTVTVTIAPNTAKAITAYSFVGLSGAAGVINETSGTIAVTVPFGTNVTNLVATFTSSGSDVKVNALAQTSGTSANDFSIPVTYTVSAADAKAAAYTVSVTIATNPAKSFTAYSFVGFTGFAGTINEPAKTIAVNLPFGTSPTNLVAVFTSTGAGVKVSSAVQTSGTTANNFNAPLAYTVTAADGTTATYTVNVVITPNPTKAITAFSFVGFTGAAGTVNESAKTVTVTVPFGTDVTGLVATFTSTGPVATVGTTVQTSTATANNFSTPVAYIVTAADGTTVIYNVSVIIAPNPAKAMSAFSFVGFTGFAGTVDESAKTIAVTVPFGTNVTAMVAAYTTTGAVVKVGTAVQTSTASANDFTAPVVYTVSAEDNSTATYTVTVTIAANPAKAITSFSFVGYAGAGTAVNELNKTIAVKLPYGTTDVTNLTATFTATGTDVKVGTLVQTSGTTPNNFTAPVTYIVTAADGTTAKYAVTVTVSLNTDKGISAYSLAGVTGVINDTTKSIAVTLPTGTVVTALAATFTTSGTGATVVPLAVPQISGITQNNFTAPVEYIVTAADGSVVKYTVTATVSVDSGPAPGAVNLGTAANYAILASSGVSTIPTSVVTGNVGLSPAARGALTGWSEVSDATDTFSTSIQVVAPFKLYAADYVGGTTIVNLTTAVADMGIAYTDAAGRTPTSAQTTNVGAGTLTSLTLTPGVYEWGTSVLIPTDLVLSGNATDVWIFKISGTLTMAAAKNVTLAGGALSKNIFWQVTDAVSIGTGTHFEGNILGKKSITFGNLASINGRLLAQTAVVLDATTVTAP